MTTIQQLCDRLRAMFIPASLQLELKPRLSREDAERIIGHIESLEATIEKCKAIAESAIEREKEKDTHGDAFEVCHLALTEIVTAAEAAREGKDP